MSARNQPPHQSGAQALFQDDVHGFQTPQVPAPQAQVPQAHLPPVVDPQFQAHRFPAPTHVGAPVAHASPAPQGLGHYIAAGAPGMAPLAGNRDEAPRRGSFQLPFVADKFGGRFDIGQSSLPQLPVVDQFGGLLDRVEIPSSQPPPAAVPQVPQVNYSHPATYQIIGSGQSISIGSIGAGASVSFGPNLQFFCSPPASVTHNGVFRLVAGGWV